MINHTIQTLHLSQFYAERQWDWDDSTKDDYLTSL